MYEGISRDGSSRALAAAHEPASFATHAALGFNGSLQGSLMRKLAVNAAGAVAVVNSTFKRNEMSRVWLFRGQAAKSRPSSSQDTPRARAMSTTSHQYGDAVSTSPGHTKTVPEMPC